MAVVYKITRKDGKSYIGIAKKFEYRLSQHKKSERFSSGISHYTILFEGNYKECSELEESFIAEHDTFNNGLNKTKTGKGFREIDHTGLKRPEDTRMKQREAWQARKDSGWQREPIPHTKESKLKMSEARKGFVWKPPKLTKDQVDDIRKSFSSQANFMLTLGQIHKLVRKRDMNKYTENMTAQEFLKTSPVSKNGKAINYSTLFRIEFSKRYHVTAANIGRIISNKTWNGAKLRND